MIPRPPRSTLSLHDALPICHLLPEGRHRPGAGGPTTGGAAGDRGLSPDGDGEIAAGRAGGVPQDDLPGDRKSTRLNSSHLGISYAVFCLKKKNKLKKESTV